MSESGPEDERLQAIYDRLDELDPTTFEADAAKLLHGLGFEEKMMAKATKDMSGVYRPKISWVPSKIRAIASPQLFEPGGTKLCSTACVPVVRGQVWSPRRQLQGAEQADMSVTQS